MREDMLLQGIALFVIFLTLGLVSILKPIWMARVVALVVVQLCSEK